ncbi:hypothetical protein D3C84_855230 [compost metagenome]
MNGEPAISSVRSASVSGPIRDCGGATRTRWTIPGVPLSCRVPTSASPMPNSVNTDKASNAGFGRKPSATARRDFCSLAVNARKPCWMRRPNWARTSSGKSPGDWVTKYTPTPLERISRTTCSSRSCKALGVPANNRCASSKNSANRGLSASPRSGSCSNSSASSHNRNVA